MKLMKLTLRNQDKASNELWLNPMHVQGFVRQKDGSTYLCLAEYTEHSCATYTIEEPPEEVARRFEEATR